MTARRAVTLYLVAGGTVLVVILLFALAQRLSC